jgi:hypothetical protein
VTEERKIRAALKVDASQIRLPDDLLERIDRQVVMEASARSNRWLRLRLGPALEVVAACIVLAALVGVAAFRNLSHTPAQAGGEQAHTPPSPLSSRKDAPSIDPDAKFAAALADQLTRSGVAVIQVKRSVYESFFPQHHQASWIQTDHGIVEAVFFDNAQDANAVQVREGSATVGHVYEISMGDWRQTLKPDRPLFFATKGNIWVVSESEALVAAIRRM